MQGLPHSAAEPGRLPQLPRLLLHTTGVALAAAAVSFMLCVAFTGNPEAMAMAFKAASLSITATVAAGVTYLIIRPWPVGPAPTYQPNPGQVGQGSPVKAITAAGRHDCPTTAAALPAK